MGSSPAVGRWHCLAVPSHLCPYLGLDAEPFDSQNTINNLENKADHDRRATHPVRLLTPLHQPASEAQADVSWPGGAHEPLGLRHLGPALACDCAFTVIDPFSPQAILGEIPHAVRGAIHVAKRSAQRQTGWSKLRTEVWGWDERGEVDNDTAKLAKLQEQACVPCWRHVECLLAGGPATASSNVGLGTCLLHGQRLVIPE